VDFFGVDAERRVAQFVAGETAEMGVGCIQLGVEFGAADFVQWKNANYHFVVPKCRNAARMDSALSGGHGLTRSAP